MRKSFTLFVMLLLVSIVQAQEKTVSGNVTDSKNQPLAGVTVSEKNGTNNTVTDNAGNYNLLVTGKKPVLVFSFVGFAASEVAVENDVTISISLKPENAALQEVYVVAYGNQTRKNITSAISVVNSEQIRRQQVTSVTQALQGTAPGVLVINSSGQPGDNPEIRIRGIASVNASAEPLIVVDGIPFNGNLNMINPSDIDNFSVLKDASATALYGSRAANGVILINTKTGRRSQKSRVTLSSTFGWSQRALPEYDLVNTPRLLELNWEALKNLYVDAGVPDAEAATSTDLVPEFLYYNPYGVEEPVGPDGKLVSGITPKWNTDWTKELTRKNAARRDINLGVSGGSTNNTYYFGLGYLGQEGYLATSQFKRVSTRFNFNSDVNKWLTLGVRSQYVYSDQNYPNQAGTSFDNVVQYIRTMSGLFPVYQRDDNGELILDASGKPIWDFGNPDPSRTYNQNRQVLQPSNLLATTYLNEERRQRHMTSLNGYAEAKILPSLKLRSNFGLDRYEFTSLSYENPEFGNGETVGGRITRSIQGTTSWTWNNMLTYKQQFGDHNVEVMGSSEFYRYQFTDQTGQKTGFPFGGLFEFNTAANTESLTGYTDNLAIMSFLGRIKYDYKGRYFIEGTFRRDGSSRFAKDYRWGSFPAVGVSWLISDEAFMQDLSPKVNLLKLRASYGRVGNEALTSYFPYINTFGTAYDELDRPGVYFNQLGNTSIAWEKQGNFNIGLDFGLFENRLNGSVDYFQKDAIDLLFSRPLVISGGIPSVDFNIGDLTNKGWEVNLGGALVKGKKFSWDLGLNATFIHNEFKKLPQEKLLANPYQREVGKSVYEFFIPEWAGVDPEDGAGMWYADELNNTGDPTGKRITTKSYAEATRYYQGTAIPKVSGGLNSRFNYAGFDLSVLFNFALGGKYLDENYQSLISGISASAGSALHTDYENRWQKQGDISDVPRLDLNNTDYAQVSTRYLFNGDYARLRNITIGYNIHPKTKGNFIENIRIYGQADNIWTISGLKKGADPEASITGRTGTTSSVFKTYSAGVEFTF
ncbi:MAG: TonB-dependent receptor [Bacteroidota bacterium]